jgi:hypothetical protein
MRARTLQPFAPSEGLLDHSCLWVGSRRLITIHSYWRGDVT